jgi:hypothetical protein
MAWRIAVARQNMNYLSILGWLPMNKFQAMALIMATLSEGGHLKPGTQEYKIARQLVSEKIDRLGPEAALQQAKKWKGKMLNDIRIEDMMEELRGKFPYLNV